MADNLQSLIKCDVSTPQFLRLFKQMLHQDWDMKSYLIHGVACSNTISKLTAYFNELAVAAEDTNRTSGDVGELISAIIKVSTFILENDVSIDKEDFGNLFWSLKRLISSASVREQLNIGVIDAWNNLEKICYEKNGKKKKLSVPREDEARIASKSCNFRDLTLLPSSAEVNESCPSTLRPILARGAYESVERYLNDHYRLVREDYVGSLRKGLNAYREAVARGDSGFRYEKIRVYRNVRFERNPFSKVGAIAYLVNFHPSNSTGTDYETARFFMQGSLLMFSRDHFQTFFCAIVHYFDANLLRSGKVYVTTEQNGCFNEDFLFHPDTNFTMIESDVFWKPYSSMLEVLNGYAENCFPMREHIVYASCKVGPPAYLRNVREFNVFGHLVKPLDVGNWPGANKVGLDTHQYQALQMALTKKFSLIQGPPATGKTFLGLQIVKLLLKNVDEKRICLQNPIVIICLSNEVLDQFLEGILKFESKIIRIGGRPRSEQLNQFNFKEKLKAHRTPLFNDQTADAVFERRIRRMIGGHRYEVNSILTRIDKLFENLKILEKPAGIFSFKCLKEVMTSEALEVVYNNASLFTWLLKEGASAFPEPENFDFLDELDCGVATDQNALDKELCGVIFKTKKDADTRNENFLNEKKGEEELEEDIVYCVSLNGLIKICQHYKKELHSKPDPQSTAHAAAKKELIALIQSYFILEDNLDKTLVDEMLLEKTRSTNLLKLPIDHRWNMYYHWVEAKKEVIKRKIEDLKKKYHSIIAEIDKYVQERNVYILKTAAVVGMTTTRAAAFHTTMQKLKPSVAIVIEEAAEILEAHIVTSINEFTEHLILIGDHKQMKPTTGSWELAIKYNLDCSLFERMINNGMDYLALRVQHRMRPEISALLVRSSIYENLLNHESVCNFGAIKGVQRSVFFLDHTSSESVSLQDFTSFKNTYEADFAIQFCMYLVDQGYNPERITILSSYSAQNTLISQGKTEKIVKVQCYVLDDYQGQENDIIILSLVRSNQEGNIGFLKVENRVCVALSRARKGLFMIGNMSILARYNIWKKIKETLELNKEIDTALALRCKKHSTLIKVTKAEDFGPARVSGCGLQCKASLPCKHMCLQPCHFGVDPNHEGEFSVCKSMDTRTLKCGHSVTVPCGQTDISKYVCKAEVVFKSTKCKHMLIRECFNPNTRKIVCKNICNEVLPSCGHKCPRVCHPKNDDHATYSCQKKCDRKNETCPKKHRCQKKCGEPCGNCLEMVIHAQSCGHTVALPCSNTDQLLPKCTEKCDRMCPKCFSHCKKLCWEDCEPCPTKVYKFIEECGHPIKVQCGRTPSRSNCKVLQNVHKTSICGHNMVYGVPCGISRTDFKVEDYVSNCKAPCNAKLTNCDHGCSGTCGLCMRGKAHVGCGQRCNTKPAKGYY